MLHFGAATAKGWRELSHRARTPPTARPASNRRTTTSTAAAPLAHDEGGQHYRVRRLQLHVGKAPL